MSRTTKKTKASEKKRRAVSTRKKGPRVQTNAAWLKAAAEQKERIGLSVVDLAKSTGAHTSMLFKILSGETESSVYVPELSAALGINLPEEYLKEEAPTVEKEVVPVEVLDETEEIDVAETFYSRDYMRWVIAGDKLFRRSPEAFHEMLSAVQSMAKASKLLEAPRA